MPALSNEFTSKPAIPQIGDAFRPALSFFHNFFQREASSSILLLAATIMALILANSYLSQAYYDLWNTKISIGFGHHDIIKSMSHWINDGLMTFFSLRSV